jgi:hypothetical protein
MRVFMCALCVCGCFGAHSEGFHSGRSDVETMFRADGLRRAAFDLECPQEQIDVVELVAGAWGSNFGAQVGATGCGRRAVYVFTNLGQWHSEAKAVTASSDARPL